MAEKSNKANKTKQQNKTTGIVVGIIVAIIVVAAIVIGVVLISKNNSRLDDAYFKSDGSKYVLTLDANDLVDEGDGLKPIKAHIVYYYSGDTITDLKAYYLFSDADTAKKALAKYRNNSDSLYKDVSINDNYVIITSNASDYEGTSATDIKQQIDLMESIKNMPDSNPDDSIDTTEDTTESTETIESTETVEATESTTTE